jgi:chromosome segregation ATPase
MKNVKAKVLAALVAATILIPTASVYAAETTTTATKDKYATAISKQQAKLDQLKAKLEDKTLLSEKKLQIKQAQETNSALRKEIAAKKTTMEALKKEISQKKAQLSPDDKAKIKAQLEVVKTQLSSAKDMKGSIKEDLATIKADIKDKNFDAAKAELDSIITVQNSRTENLKALSSSIDTLINLMQTALASATPAPTN